MSCQRTMEVHALLDGEMDGVSAAAVERHIAGCPSCTALRRDIEAIREGLQRIPYRGAGKKLREDVRHTLALEAGGTVRRSRLPFWKGAASGAAAMTLAASLILLAVRPSPQDEVAHDIVTAHLRSLMGSHLVDVESSDHHTVRPWFDGRVDVAPPTEDFTAQGFHLVGGRLDYIHGTRAAVLVYRHGAHVVNVFAWKSDGAVSPGLHSRNGYTLLAWQSGDIFYCAISDSSAAEIENLAHLMRQSA